MVDWLAGKRVKGTSSERSGFGLSLGGTGIGGWVELGRHTLTQAGDTLAVTNLANKRYYMVLIKTLHSGSYNPYLRFNNDSNGNYSERFEFNGAEGTVINQTELHANLGGSAQPAFNVLYITNFSGKQKYVLRDMVYGGSSTLFRSRSSGKWANLNDTISSIGLYNTGSGDFSIGSEIVVLGYDPADTHTTNFWTELASVSGTGSSTNLSSGTITAKKYLWIQLYQDGVSGNINVTFNNDTTSSNYLHRISTDSGSDSTTTGYTNIFIRGNGVPNYTNTFIDNNSGNDKLCIADSIQQGTAGASYYPSRREAVLKWASSNQITEIDFDSSSGNWNSNSILKIWGAD
jgi:hypothetical protein